MNNSQEQLNWMNISNKNPSNGSKIVKELEPPRWDGKRIDWYHKAAA